MEEEGRMQASQREGEEETRKDESGARAAIYEQTLSGTKYASNRCSFEV
jgi:hypothetical protein